MSKRKPALGAVFAAALLTVGFAPSLAADLGNLPKGWIHAGTAPDSYAMGVDAAAAYDGHTSIAVLAKPSADSTKFGTAMQIIDSQNYRGKRIRFRAVVRSQNVSDWAGLWMRIDGTDKKMLQFDNMHDRPIRGTTDWTTHDIVLDVPRDSVDIAFGVLLAGSGDVWLAEPELTDVDSSTPTTNLKPMEGPQLSKQPTLTW